MILPIFGYGQPVLKRIAEDIPADYPKLDQLIANMWETMYNAHGVGLAGPQVGLALRIFVIDTEQVKDDEKLDVGFKKVFLNARILEEEGTPWSYEEGCLSIPNLREPVDRQPRIVLQYQDEQFNDHEETFDGFAARVIQHEHDHLDGILFTDHLPPLRRRLLKGKLRDISIGKTDAKYKMRFPQVK